MFNEEISPNEIRLVRDMNRKDKRTKLKSMKKNFFYLI